MRRRKVSGERSGGELTRRVSHVAMWRISRHASRHWMDLFWGMRWMYVLGDVRARRESMNRHWSTMSGRPSSSNRTGGRRRLNGMKDFQQGNINSLTFGRSAEGSFAAFGRRHVLVGHRNHKQREAKNGSEPKREKGQTKRLKDGDKR